MSNIYVKSEQVIDAPPEKIYAALKDYRQLRPQILTPNFLDYRVKQGGVGKGTVIDYRLKAAGRERPYHMQVDETVRGKVLTERDTNSSLITRWTLLPVKDGKKTQVSLSSEWEGSSGIGGFFERTFAPMGLRRIYGSMLSMLARSMQPEEKKSVAEEEEPGNIASDLGKFILLVGLVFGIAIAMGFLQKAQLQRSA
jgi:uncharacterized protein YndB with AHSA1/START domain